VVESQRALSASDFPLPYKAGIHTNSGFDFHSEIARTTTIFASYNIFENIVDRLSQAGKA
jgi:hypothetical protein